MSNGCPAGSRLGASGPERSRGSAASARSSADITCAPGWECRWRESAGRGRIAASPRQALANDLAIAIRIETINHHPSKCRKCADRRGRHGRQFGNVAGCAHLPYRFGCLGQAAAAVGRVGTPAVNSNSQNTTPDDVKQCTSAGPVPAISASAVLSARPLLSRSRHASTTSGGSHMGRAASAVPGKRASTLALFVEQAQGFGVKTNQ